LENSPVGSGAHLNVLGVTITRISGFPELYLG